MHSRRAALHYATIGSKSVAFISDEDAPGKLGHSVFFPTETSLAHAVDTKFLFECFFIIIFFIFFMKTKKSMKSNIYICGMFLKLEGVL